MKLFSKFLYLGISSALANNVIEMTHTKNFELHEPRISTWMQNFRVKSLSLSEKTNLVKSMLKIDKHNSKTDKTWTMALNKYSHLSDQEFRVRNFAMAEQHCSATNSHGVHSVKELAEGYYGIHPNYINSNFEKMQVGAAPKFKDWRTEGTFVTPVKNQGHCGSCWTFSSTGAMESAWAIHKNQLFSLAEQQLIDCAGNFDNNGCSGGLPSHAFEYVAQNGGIDSEEVYQYRAKELGVCNYDNDLKSPVQLKGSFNITEGDEDTLFEAVAYLNPVSIAYEVVDDFRHYANGVYTSDTCKSGPTDVNHAVLAVGYGTDTNGKDYWIIKNSWGADWGMDGYFWMERGKNMCGIATCASFPVV